MIAWQQHTKCWIHIILSTYMTYICDSTSVSLLMFCCGVRRTASPFWSKALMIKCMNDRIFIITAWWFRNKCVKYWVDDSIILSKKRHEALADPGIQPTVEAGMSKGWSSSPRIASWRIDPLLETMQITNNTILVLWVIPTHWKYL